MRSGFILLFTTIYQSIIQAKGSFLTPASKNLNINTFLRNNLFNYNTKLYNVIKGVEDEDLGVDPGSGGVSLAIESAIKIIGNVAYKKDGPVAKPMDLKQYKKVVQIDEAAVRGNIICTGSGKEVYQISG